MITKHGTVDWVVDHWTLMCTLDLGLGVLVRKPVRLYGVSEPTRAAIELLQRYEGSQAVFTISEDKSGRYGQLLATVVCDSMNLNDLLLETGYAQPYKRN